MIYDPKNETMKRADLEQLQMERLQATLNRVYRNVTFYRKLYDGAGIDIEKIRSVRDLKNLPFTTKNDLKDGYPYDLFAVPLRDIVRIHQTSGTTGKPIVVGYTKNDLRVWCHLVARVLTAVGITQHDFAQIAFNYNISSASLGFQYAAEEIGASVIPTANFDAARQIVVMKDYRTSALISTPGFALHIALALEELGMSPKELSLKTGLFGAEPWSERMRTEIETRLGIRAYDNYGLTEVIGPGVAFEDEERNGMYVNEDHFLVEVIDPETLAPLPFGEKGELVFTTLTKEGFPLVRYRSGDIASLSDEPGESGRTFLRMSRVQGRTDDMIIVDGVNVFPSQIEQVLLEIEGIEPHYEIVLERVYGMDVLEVRVEIDQSIFSDEAKNLVRIKNRIAQRLLTTLGISPKISLIEPKTLDRCAGGKMRRVVDKRNESW